METERILITVRTYPTISATYIETVCTGGITDGGEWRRLVPVALRYLDEEKQYKTFDIVAVEVRPGKDGRPETRTPNLPSLQIVDKLKDWTSRCDWINPTILPSMRAMRDRGRTLAPVAVSEVIDLETRRESSEWTPAQTEKLKQANLFEEHKPLEKIPYAFHVRWKDLDGAEHRSRILTWELYQTYRQFRQKYADPIKEIRAKFLGDLFDTKRRVSFFMGNLAKWRQVFIVTGWFIPPKEIANGETLW